MAEPDPVLERIDRLGIGLWGGRAFRHTSPGRDPLSGEGARQFGGRWNSPGISTVYLAAPRETCLAEFHRMAATQPVSASDFDRRAIHEIDVDSLRVLDLRSELALATVGLELSDVMSQSWLACQQVGDAASFLNCEGILTISATGAGHIIAVFRDIVGPDKLRVIRTDIVEFG